MEGPEPCITFEYDDNGNRTAATLELCGGLLGNNLVDSTQEQMMMELDSNLFFSSDTALAISSEGDERAGLLPDAGTVQANGGSTISNAQGTQDSEKLSTVAVAVTVYPNPVIGLLNITCSADREFTYRITSLRGSKVFRQGKVSTGRTAVDVSMLAAGNYLVSVTMDDEYKVFQIAVQ